MLIELKNRDSQHTSFVCFSYMTLIFHIISFVLVLSSRVPKFNKITCEIYECGGSGAFHGLDKSIAVVHQKEGPSTSYRGFFLSPRVE
jgi:hypothetical protein